MFKSIRRIELEISNGTVDFDSFAKFYVACSANMIDEISWDFERDVLYAEMEE